MTTNFPGAIDTFTHPNPNDPRSGTTSLSTEFSTVQDAISALETKVGANSSLDTTSVDFKLSGIPTTDKAVSKTGTETLSSKTLTAPKINVGGDATGDVYYRDAGGLFQRLAAGATSTILSMVSGLPSWIPNPAASNASTTVKGVVEIATAAEITAGTAIGGTGAELVVTPDQLALSAPTFNGANLTNVPSTATYKTGIVIRAGNAASGSQTIAHGLGKVPKLIRINTLYLSLVAAAIPHSYGVYDGTNTTSNYYGGSTQSGSQAGQGNSTTNIINMFIANSFGNGSQVATIAVDATNIILTWTLNDNSGNTPFSSNNFSILWEASA